MAMETWSEPVYIAYSIAEDIPIVSVRVNATVDYLSIYPYRAAQGMRSQSNHGDVCV